MAEGKYCRVGDAIKQITSEYVRVGDAIKQGTINAIRVSDAIKQISVGEKQIFACEQGSDRLYGIDDAYTNLTGWPVFGGTIADPADVACDDEGNSYWACANSVYKYDVDGNQIWEYTGFTTQVLAICVDLDGYVYAADYVGDVKSLNGNLVPGDVSFVRWSQSIRVATDNPCNALAIDYSAGQLYAAFTTDATGRMYRLLQVNGNYTVIYYNPDGKCLSVAIDEDTPSLYIGDDAGQVRKISTAGYVYYTSTKLGEVYAVRVGHDGYGYYTNGSQGDVGKFTLATGTDVWQDSPAGTSRGLAVDAFGNVYSSHGAYGSVNAVIRKNNSSGVEQWTWQPHINSRWRGVAVSPGIKAAGFS